VTDADRILFLENGRVGAAGTHQELLIHSPGYARLYRLHHPDAAGSARALPGTGPRVGRHRAPEGACSVRTPDTTPAPRSPGPGDRAPALVPGQTAGPASPVLPPDVPANGGLTGWFGVRPDAPVPADGALSALPLPAPVPTGVGGEPYLRRGRHAAPPTPRPRPSTGPGPSEGASAAPISVPPAAS
jgi:hypothetical protein